jgi:hypothetical protein
MKWNQKITFFFLPARHSKRRKVILDERNERYYVSVGRQSSWYCTSCLLYDFSKVGDIAIVNREIEEKKLIKISLFHSLQEKKEPAWSMQMKKELAFHKWKWLIFFKETYPSVHNFSIRPKEREKTAQEEKKKEKSL